MELRNLRSLFSGEAAQPISRPKLFGIQSIRGIAALMVVFCHLRAFQAYYYPSASSLPVWFIIGESGVDLFFIISGFIIMYVTLRPLQSWKHQLAFLIRRLGRIYPVYWAVVIPLLAASLVFHGSLKRADDARFDALSLFFLFPRHAAPFLVVAWSLTFEIYFYLVACVVFRWSGRIRVLLLLGWFIVIVTANLLHPRPFSNSCAALCFSPLCAEFITGSLLAYFLFHGRFTINRRIALFVVLFFGFMAFAIGVRHGEFQHNSVTRVFFYGFPALMIVWMMIQMELQGNWLWLKRIAPVGDRSYSIYLLHLPFITAVFQLSSKIFHGSSTLLSFFTAFVALLGIAVPVEIYYRFVERPSHAFARKLASVYEGPRSK